MSRLKGGRAESRKTLGIIEHANLKNVSNSELNSVEAALPKSTIDVALELIDQAEKEAVDATRIAAFTKPKSRGRPPLRKSVERTTSFCANDGASEQSKNLLQNDGGRTQGGISHECSAILPKRGVPSYLTNSALPVLKDHLEVEAAARVVPPSREISLFGTDTGDVESADFHRMVLLNYGSADGRLEDDDDQNSLTNGHNKNGILAARKVLNFKDGTLKNKGECSGLSNHQHILPSASFRRVSSPININSTEVSRMEICVSGNSERNSTDVKPPYRRHEKKARGRPKKNPTLEVKTLSQKRPRGRPRKNGTDGVRKSEQKPFEKKPLAQIFRRQPRRAALMVQDFIELYSKVQLDELEAFHAQAISFVKMLVDEYAAEAKKDSKCSLEDGGTANFDFNIEQKSDADMEESMKHCISLKRANVDVETSIEPCATYSKESGEPNGLGENNAEIDYHSNSIYKGNFGEDFHKAVHSVNLGQRREHTNDFIDAIPVIRGTVLQVLPTVVDSL